MITKQNFVDRFVVGFLAAWSVKKIESTACDPSHVIYSHQPIEDAIMIAEHAWDQYVRIVKV